MSTEKALPGTRTRWKVVGDRCWGLVLPDDSLCPDQSIYSNKCMFIGLSPVHPVDDRGQQNRRWV